MHRLIDILVCQLRNGTERTDATLLKVVVNRLLVKLCGDLSILKAKIMLLGDLHHETAIDLEVRGSA